MYAVRHSAMADDSENWWKTDKHTDKCFIHFFQFFFFNWMNAMCFFWYNNKHNSMFIILTILLYLLLHLQCLWRKIVPENKYVVCLWCFMAYFANFEWICCDGLSQLLVKHRTSMRWMSLVSWLKNVLLKVLVIIVSSLPLSLSLVAVIIAKKQSHCSKSKCEFTCCLFFKIPMLAHVTLAD